MVPERCRLQQVHDFGGVQVQPPGEGQGLRGGFGEIGEPVVEDELGPGAVAGRPSQAVARPSAPKTGASMSRTCGGPLARMTSSPAWAGPSLPETGASTNTIPRASAIRRACVVPPRRWRSSRSGTGSYRNGKSRPSGAARSSACSRARLAALASPSVSQANRLEQEGRNIPQMGVRHHHRAVDDGCEHGRRRRVLPDPHPGPAGADQAALFGVLTQIEGLGLELVEVRRCESPGCATPPHPGTRKAESS